jgi:phage shock protein C
MVEKIKYFFEQQAFGVCSWWGQKLGINTEKIRTYFIYISFLTIGSPLIIYLIMAFILENKRYFKPSRHKKISIWDL